MTEELPSRPSGDIPPHSNIIKFSHYYHKMPVGWQFSDLLEVVPLKLSDLGTRFINYDTTATDGEKYPLPKSGNYLLLLLQSSEGHIWTTLRRSTPRKRDYYMRKRGQTFNCIVETARDIS
jgi:hypothetical protein